MTIQLTALQQQRRDTAANWTSANPTLLTGEIGYETDTGKFKIGDGSTVWAGLGYLPIPDSSGLIPISQLLLPLGSASAPSLAFTGDANTGIFSPGADSLAITTAGTQRVTVDSSGNVGIGDSAPSEKLNVAGNIMLEGADQYLYLSNAGTANSGIYVRGRTAAAELRSHSTGSFTWEVTGSEGMRIDSSGRLLIGTSISPSGGDAHSQAAPLLVQGRIGSGADSGRINLQRGSSTVNNSSIGTISFTDSSNNAYARLEVEADATTGTNDYPGRIKFSTTANGASSPTERMRIDSSGNVGIGVTSMPHALCVNGTIQLGSASSLRSSSSGGQVQIQGGSTYPGGNIVLGGGSGNDNIVFNTTGASTSSTERMRIDSSGRLLVGTSTARTMGTTLVPALQSEGTSNNTSALALVQNSSSATIGSSVTLAKTRASANGGATVVQSGENLGSIYFEGADGTNLVSAARIFAAVDGTPGANDMPGRLVFSTTADGASTPTERMRIDKSGLVDIGGYGNGGLTVTTPVGTPLQLNRTLGDGTLVLFKQDGTTEGTISVSGTTVSYNGAHLSRWSQLPGGAERTEILRGTVLSNIDEMCGWGEEDNEQLNRMKVSDVEGDKNVSGVFQSWDNDDDTHTNDFYCAMTGDFIIRIAESVTVQRGDLLMSAGDGTAKPQDDDIIRSKTVAKVTSTHVTCTYDDGSYCVPCVLMAC